MCVGGRGMCVCVYKLEFVDEFFTHTYSHTHTHTHHTITTSSNVYAQTNDILTSVTAPPAKLGQYTKSDATNQTPNYYASVVRADIFAVILSFIVRSSVLVGTKFTRLLPATLEATQARLSSHATVRAVKPGFEFSLL